MVIKNLEFFFFLLFCTIFSGFILLSVSDKLLTSHHEISDILLNTFVILNIKIYIIFITTIIVHNKILKHISIIHYLYIDKCFISKLKSTVSFLYLSFSLTFQAV